MKKSECCGALRRRFEVYKLFFGSKSPDRDAEKAYVGGIAIGAFGGHLRIEFPFQLGNQILGTRKQGIQITGFLA